MKSILLSCVLSVVASVALGFQDADSLETALKTAEGKDRVDVLNKLYVVHNRTDPAKALEYSIHALELANEISYQKGRANALNNIGVIYKNQGVFDEALEYYIESLRISTDLKDRQAEASVLNNIGSVYRNKSIHDKALIYFIESYEIFKSIGANAKLIDAINNIGNAYMEMGREDLALDYYSEAMSLSEVGGYTPEISNPLTNVGNVYFYRGDFPNALIYYQRALKLEEDRSDILGKAHALTNIGSVYLEMADYSEANEYLNEALENASSMGAYPLLRVIYQNLAESHARQGKYEQAYEYRKRYDEAKDFVFNEKSSRMMAQMEVAVDLQEKEKELEKLKKDQQIKSLQIANSRIVILLAVMGSIILLAGGIIIYRVRNTKSA